MAMWAPVISSFIHKAATLWNSAIPKADKAVISTLNPFVATGPIANQYQVTIGMFVLLTAWAEAWLGLENAIVVINNPKMTLV